MKTIFDQVPSSCEHCGQIFAHTVYGRVSGNDYPELRTRVLGNTIFASTCPHCGKWSSMVRDLFYNEHSPHRFAVYFVPDGLRDRLPSMMPQLLLLQTDGCKIHIVREVSEIASIVRAYAEGHPPSQVEMIGSKNDYQEAHELQQRTGAIQPFLEEFSASGKMPEGFLADKAPKKRSLLERLFQWFAAPQLPPHPVQASKTPAQLNPVTRSLPPIGILIPGDTTLDAETVRLFGVAGNALKKHGIGELRGSSAPCTRDVGPNKVEEPWGRLGSAKISCDIDKALVFLIKVLRDAGAPAETTLIVTRNGRDEEIQIGPNL